MVSHDPLHRLSDVPKTKTPGGISAPGAFLQDENLMAYRGTPCQQGISASREKSHANRPPSANAEKRDDHAIDRNIDQKLDDTAPTVATPIEITCMTHAATLPLLP